MKLDPLHHKLANGKRKSVDTYREILKNKAQKYMQIYKYNAYDQLHLYMGYEGNTDTRLKKLGWKNAKILIQWCADKYPKGLTGRTKN